MPIHMPAQMSAHMPTVMRLVVPRRDGPGPSRDGPGPSRDGPGPSRDGPGPSRDGPGPSRDGPRPSRVDQSTDASLS